MLNLFRTNSENTDFLVLVGELDKHLWAMYGDEMKVYHPLNKIENIPTVVVGYINNEPVGCGVFKKFDDTTAEVKRMFVRPEQRNFGIAASILKELEAWAKEIGFTKMILETGPKQVEAIHLYEKSGYKKCDKFPPYTDMTDSICMDKEI